MYTVVGLAVAGALLLGWVIALVMGIISVRRGQRALGVLLIIVSALWGLLVVLGGGMALYTYSQAPSSAPTTTFDPTTYKGPMGSLTTTWQGTATLAVRSLKERKSLKVVSTTGSFRLPADTYSVQSWSQSLPAKTGQNWALECRYPSKLNNVALAANAQVPLNLGPPLTAKIKANPASGGLVSLELGLADAAGNTYTVMATGKGAKPPAFEASNAAGQVVWRGSFEYG